MGFHRRGGPGGRPYGKTLHPFFIASFIAFLWEHLDDLIEDMKDNAYYIARFLQSWYDRVNGITKED
jgi:hypothetical protein